MQDILNHSVNPQSHTSSTLLALVKAKDQDAWDRLATLYSPLVYHWCRRNGLQEEDARNVGQDVFLVVFQKIGEFRRERPGDTFRGWLRVITRNKVRQHLQRQQTSVIGVGGDNSARAIQEVADQKPDAGTLSQENRLLYQQAVELIRGEFSESHVKAFLATVLQNRSVAETAGELQISANAVYIARSRILQRLRQEFAGLIDFDATETS